MRIGLIGAGNVGSTLGKGWIEKGHEVLFGVRNPSPDRKRELKSKAGAAVRVGTVSEASGFGDVVVLATPWGSTQDAIAQAGDLTGKVLLDCTNPLGSSLGLEIGFKSSGAEMVAAWAKGARIVKIFNTTGFNNMANPDYNGTPATMFFCGNDDSAKSAASDLAKDLGFEPIDAGGLTEARLLEPLAMLWIRLAMAQGMGREIAFKLMRR